MNILIASAVIASFLFSSCQSAPHLSTSESQLNGYWALAAYDCEKGKLTKAGKDMNDRLRDGKETYLYRFDGEKVTISRKDEKCNQELVQNWAFKNTSVIVSDVEAAPILENNTSCQPLEKGRSRTHEFEVLGTLLRVKREEGFARIEAAKNDGQLCDKGRDIAIFSKQ